MAHLGRLFSSEGENRVRLAYDAVRWASELARPLDASGFALGTGELGLEAPLEAQVPLFQQPLKVDASAKARAALTLHPAGSVLDPFGNGELVSAEDQSCLGELELNGRLALGASMSAPNTPFSLNAKAAAAAELSYRLLLPLQHGQPRIQALRQLVRRSRLPGQIDLSRLHRGEIHHLEAQLELGFDLQLRQGTELNIDTVIATFDGLPLALRAHIRASVEASLGWSLYERLTVTAGRQHTLQQGWTRLRAQRSSQHRLTLGAALSMEVEYDLATGLESILARALDVQPVEQTLEALRRVEALRAQGGWEAVRQGLRGRAADALSEYLAAKAANTGWRQWLEGSDEVQELLDLAGQVQKAYKTVDPQALGLWHDLLAKAELSERLKGGALRQDLEILAGLDLTQVDRELDRLASRDLRRVRELFETLSGVEIEAVLLLPEQAGEALTKAQNLADQALALSRSLPATALDRLRQLTTNSGLGASIRFLGQHATSMQSLQAAIEQRGRALIRRLVEKLLDKAWEAVDDTDLSSVRRWAEQAKVWLEQGAAWTERIGQELERLRGQVGFSLALELSRVSSRSALVDLEVQGRNPDLKDLLRGALPAGDLRNLLAQLAQHDDGSESNDPPFRLREAVFTFRRLRSSRAALRFLGLDARTNERLEEARIRVLEHDAVRDAASGEAGGEAGSPSPGRMHRRASYAAAFLRKHETETRSAEAGVWLRTEASGNGARLRDAYQESQSHLRLAYTHQSTAPERQEMEALDTLLHHLGFDQQEPLVASQGSAEAGLRFRLELALPGDSVAVLLDGLERRAGERRWNRDYLAAAHRWYTEALVEQPHPERQDVRLGLVLAEVVQRDDFHQAWATGRLELEDWARGFRQQLLVGNSRVPVRPFTAPPLRRWHQPYLSLRSLGEQRGRGLRAMQRLARAWDRAQESLTPAHLATLGRKAANAFSAASARRWDNPGFCFWLVLARLSRKQPQLLGQATGYASVSRRARDDEAWPEPDLLRLAGGIPQDLIEQGIFGDRRFSD